MNITVNIDWKVIAALGAAFVGSVFALKMDKADAKEVSHHAIDAWKEVAERRIGDC